MSINSIVMCTIFPFIITMALLKSKMKQLINEAKPGAGLPSVLPVPLPFVYFNYVRNIKNSVLTLHKSSLNFYINVYIHFLLKCQNLVFDIKLQKISDIKGFSCMSSYF